MDVDRKYYIQFIILDMPPNIDNRVEINEINEAFYIIFVCRLSSIFVQCLSFIIYFQINWKNKKWPVSSF